MATTTTTYGFDNQGMSQGLSHDLTDSATLAHYEVGRLRRPASMLPTLAQTLDVGVEALLGQPRTGEGLGKCGPASRLEQQVAHIGQLPKPQQRFILQMQETVLAQARR